MKISIITVVFNNVQTIENCIKSVLSQKGVEDLEYIIIDGGSSDGTLEVIKKYNDRISIIISEPDRGIYDAMNKGIKLSTGDIIGILNSDDLYYDSNILSTVIDTFCNHIYLDIVYGDLYYVDKVNINKVIRKWKSLYYHDNFFEQGNVPPHPTLFLRKSVYEKAGFFNLKYKFAADYELMFRIFKRYHFNSIYIPMVLVKMRLGGTTNRSIKNIYLGNKEILNAWVENGFNPPWNLMFKKIYKRIIQFSL